MRARLIPGSEYTEVRCFSDGEYLVSHASFEIDAFGETRVVKGHRVHRYQLNGLGLYSPVLWFTDGHTLARSRSGDKLHPCRIELWQDGGPTGTAFKVVQAVRVRNGRYLWPIVAWDAEKWEGRKAQWYAGGAQVRRDILNEKRSA